jgi:filamentous hemagglutinin family protein
MTMNILKRSLVPLLVAACCGAAEAAPTLPQVVAGQATFSQQGNVFSITNTPSTIINWQGFSVNPGEVTRFIQQSADSAVLNRILGQDPSKILGALQSNGKVFLINPNGILFGRDARVDVNGLVASTLNLSNADFLAGNRKFQAGAVAGAIKNDGAITTPSGGQVFLVAPNIENNGVITSPQGEVMLAAGHSVQLADSRDPDLHVVVSAPADQAVNLGRVIAQGGKIGIYGALVNQRGLVNANSAVVGENGKIVLKASRDTLLEQGSVTSATGLGTGGEIHLLGERVGLTGNAQVDASGAAGGGTVLVGGDYQGGNPLLPNARQAWLGKDAGIRADALANGDGGKVVLWSDGATHAYGSISARGGAASGSGGQVETSGHYLDVAGLALDAGAAHGKAGSWLLDPVDIEVTASGASASAADVAVFGNGPQEGTAKVSPATLNATNADIVLQAQRDLTVSDDLVTSHNVTAQAGQDIVVNATVKTTGGDLNFRAGRTLALNEGGKLLGNNYIDLRANGMSFDGKVGSAGGGQKPIVSLTSFEPGRAIVIGAGEHPPGSALWLDASALKDIDAYEINIGSSAHTGTLSVNAPIDLSANLVFDNANGIDINDEIKLSGQGSFAASLYGPQTNTIDITSNGSIKAGKSVLLRGDRVQIGGAIKADTVTLDTTTGAYEIGAGAIDADKLSAKGGQVMLTGANNLVKTLAGESDGDTFHVTSSEGLSVGQVGALSGIGAQDASVQLITLGALSIDAALAGGDNVTLDAAGIGGRGTVTGNLLTLRSSGGIGTSGPLHTQASVLRAYNRGTGSKAINISNVGELTLDRALQAGSGNNGAIVINNQGGMTVPSNEQGDDAALAHGLVQSAGGSISLTAHSPLTIDGHLATGSGNIRLEAGGGGAFTVHSGARIASASGDVTVIAGSTSIAQGAILVSDPSKLHLPGTPPPVLTLESCIAAPAQSGCADVMARALQACLADPNAAHCAQVLPSVVSCKANPAAPGCDAVLARDALNQCIADPKGAGCDKILPSYDTCANKPAEPGCGPVLAQRQALLACIADRKGAGCDKVLPPFDRCDSNPAELGCGPVIAQRQALLACIVNPRGAGCANILPPLELCRADGAQLGCAPVLARAAFDACLANPAGPGCAAVLPSLDSCKITGSAEGCTQVLGLAFNFCLAHPNDASCSGVLPKLSECVLDKSKSGCSVVLPTLQQCTDSPTLQGCQVMLPTLAQCVTSPAMPGCSAVLPSASFCSSHPLDPSCQVFNPAPGAGQNGQGAPVAQAVQATVNLINTGTSTRPPPAPASAGGSGTGAGSGGGAGGDSSGPNKPSDKKSGPAPSENSGAKNEKPATKMYCN